MSWLILIVLLTIVQANAADLTRLIPAETEFITGVEVSRLRATPRWPLLFEIAQRWRRFDDRVNTTGFDPSTDLDELALLSIGGSTPSDLVILRGRFDASRIAKFDPANQDGHETRYRGIRVCAPPRQSEGYLQWTASIEDMVVIGPADAVRMAIDTYLTAEPRRAWFDGGLARVRGRYDAWAVARQQAPGPEEGTGFELAWSGGVRLDSKPSAEGEVVTPSPEHAQAIAGHMRNSIANDWRGAVSRLWKTAAESVRISVDNRIVRVSGEMEWEPLLVLAGAMRHLTSILVDY